MIAEWFYPKELKEIIADLRAKDTLNEEALNMLKAETISRIKYAFGFSVFIFFPVFFMANSITVLEKNLLIFCGMAMMLFFLPLKNYIISRDMRLYIFGIKTNAIITASYSCKPEYPKNEVFYIEYAYFKVEYEFLDKSNKKHKFQADQTTLHGIFSVAPKIGRSMPIYYYETKPSEHIFYHRIKYKKYSLDLTHPEIPSFFQ